MLRTLFFFYTFSFCIVAVVVMQRAKRQQYSLSKMASALEYVRGVMPKKTAARMCGVPRKTLLDKLYCRVPDYTKPGAKSTLTGAAEGVLVNYIKLMAEVGYPVSRQELKNEVKKILDRDGRKTPFKSNMPGDDWYDAFCRRHPDIKERKPQALRKEREQLFHWRWWKIGSGVYRTISRRKLIIMNSLSTIQDGYSTLTRVVFLCVLQLAGYLRQLAPNMYTKLWQMIKLR